MLGDGAGVAEAMVTGSIAVYCGPLVSARIWGRRRVLGREIRGPRRRLRLLACAWLSGE